jgi:hypothetical protein
MVPLNGKHRTRNTDNSNTITRPLKLQTKKANRVLLLPTSGRCLLFTALGGTQSGVRSVSVDVRLATESRGYGSLLS